MGASIGPLPPQDVSRERTFEVVISRGRVKILVLATGFHG